jgi:hypothetical protein
MNGIIRMKQAMGERELLREQPTRPITLEEKIKIRRDVIRTMETFEFRGKAETLAKKRAGLALLERQLKFQSQPRPVLDDTDGLRDILNTVMREE